MSVEEKLRREAVDEVSPLYVRMKPHAGSKYHVFWFMETPMRCKCGAYTLSTSTPLDREVSTPVRPPDDKLVKKCIRRHDHLIDLKFEARKAALQADIKKIGDNLEGIVREYAFLAVHTLDTETLHRLVNMVGLVVDAEIMRTLKKHRPAETEALFEGIGKEKT